MMNEKNVMVNEKRAHISSIEEREGENSRWFFQNLMQIHATGETTNGKYFMAELSAPVGDEPPLHSHPNEEEAFYVLEGQMTVWVGDEEPIVLNKGDYAFLPRDVPHIYKVTSQIEARWLGIISPAKADGFEGFVREISSPAEKQTLPLALSPPTPEEMKKMSKIGEKYGIEFLGPPGARPADLNK